MKKCLKTAIITAGGALAAAGAVTFLVAPGHLPAARKEKFAGRNYAHRGLHKIDKSVPENSLPAFEAAARIGYGIELDVHLTADGELVVFHDDNTMRACGRPGNVEDMTLAELRELRLFGTEYGIPTLREVLDLVDNRSPLIVELKRGERNTELCEKSYRALCEYGGRYCVESFDPFILRWFRCHAPEVMRGQLSAQPSRLAKNAGKFQAFALGNLLANFISRPHFIAYEIGRKPLLVRFAERLGAMKIAWTATDWNSETANDGVIFQYYRPRVKYK